MKSSNLRKGRGKNLAILKRALRQVNQQLEKSEQWIANFGKQNTKLEQIRMLTLSTGGVGRTKGGQNG